MPHRKKREHLLARLYQYFAEFGFKQVDNVSHLTKSIDIGRSLFYFYFKDVNDLLDQLSVYHKERILEQRELVLTQSLTHLQYLEKLVEHKDLYFFAIRCKQYRRDHPTINEMYLFVLDTVDVENFKLFVKHYQLEGFSSSSMKTLYDSFRSLWYDSSDYYTWSPESATELSRRVHEMMLLLRSAQCST